MKILLSSKRHHYLTRVSIFLIIVTLIIGMVGCEPTQYNLTMAANPVEGGTATDLTNASPYTAGTVVSIKAVANLGYEFVSWTAPAGTFANANATDTTFTVPTQNVTVTANFFQGQLIRNWQDLYAIRDDPGDNYLLMNDLDSTTVGYEELASPTANGGKGWQPIGSFNVDLYKPADPFTGTFDGQGYEIRDLFIDRSDKWGVGLFGWVGGGGIIKNVGVVNANVTGYLYVGGLVGGNNYTISDCYATGNVTGNTNVGGLVGVNFEGDVSNSYATGTVTGVVGSSGVGGLVGANAGIVSNSYSTGNITSNQTAGGLVGYNLGTVSNSYSTGSVTGEERVGGLVGKNDGTVSNSFWDIETSGQATSDGGTGKTTTGMKGIATFLGAAWDIIAVAPGSTNSTYTWNIVDGVTYPFLSWQPVS
jgi:hypothetical protein